MANQHTKLFLGTAAENNADMFAKGRNKFQRGIDHGGAILSETQVIELYLAPGSGSMLGPQYGVCASTVQYIKNGGLWKHVTASLGCDPGRKPRRWPSRQERAAAKALRSRTTE